jgi:hypothetical protein
MAMHARHVQFRSMLIFGHAEICLVEALNHASASMKKPGHEGRVGHATRKGTIHRSSRHQYLAMTGGGGGLKR